MGTPRYYGSKKKKHAAKPRFKFQQQDQGNLALPLTHPVVSCRIDDVVSSGTFVSIAQSIHNKRISIRSGGLLVGHADRVLIDNVTLKVDEEGIEKIRRDKRERVVARAEGWLVAVDGFQSFRKRKPPYSCKYMHFTRAGIYSDKGGIGGTFGITFNPHHQTNFRYENTKFSLSSLGWMTWCKSGRMEGGFQ